MPSALPMKGYESASICLEDPRPTKRLRTVETTARKSLVEEDPVGTLPPHPLGIKPAGNAFRATVDLKNHAGLFRMLPDDLIAHLLDHLGSRELLGLGHTCKALYAFCYSDDPWKSIFVE
jgi:F-box domain